MIPRYKILSVAFLIAIGIILAAAGNVSKCPHEANIQLERQNVFFIGVDNPITVTVSGIAADKIIVETDNGTIKPTAKSGGYIVRVDSLNKTNITVSYKEGGKTTTAAQYSYRNKRIPDPVTYVGSIRHEGIILKHYLQNVNGVFTRMENFDFDGAFRPQSFSMSVLHDSAWKEYKTTGPAISTEMKAALDNAMPEDRILFHNVVTKGPDSTLRKVNCVLITVK
jgi:hypothetical protein